MLTISPSHTCNDEIRGGMGAVTRCTAKSFSLRELLGSIRMASPLESRPNRPARPDICLKAATLRSLIPYNKQVPKKSKYC